jgi:AcrR family transcriptional regulator
MAPVLLPDARDPRVTFRARGAGARILDACLKVFGERGWYGTNMQEIAREAGVSKGLLYSYWPSTEQVLQAAFDRMGRSQEASFEGLSLREALIAECHAMADLYLGPHGLAIIRLWVEGQVGPETLRASLTALNARRVHSLRHRVRQAVETGELPASADVVRLLDIIEGAVFAHINVTPRDKRPLLRQSLDDYIERLVDTQLFLESAAGSSSDVGGVASGQARRG